MKQKLKVGTLLSRPDLAYPCLVALIIAVGLLARAVGVLPLR